MKKFQIILSAMLVMALAVIASCDGSDDPSAEELFLQRLTATWTLQEVKMNGQNMTDYFPGLTLTVNSDKSFSVQHPVSPIWPANGTFTLKTGTTPDLFNVQRADGVLITVTALSEHTLKYTIPYEVDNGRVKEISGDYEFTMTK